MATKQIELATKPLDLQIELATKQPLELQIELATKRIESVEAQTKLEEVKQRYRKDDNESLSRNSSIPSVLSINEDHPVAAATTTKKQLVEQK